jgi:hypothetical protein
MSFFPDNPEVDEPMPLLYGRVFQCWVTDKWYPRFVQSTGGRWQTIVDENGRSVTDRYGYVQREYVEFITIADQRVSFDDENFTQHWVHRSAVDYDCEWCSNPVIEDHATYAARRWSTRNSVHLCNSCAENASSCNRCGHPSPDDDMHHVGSDSFTVGEWCVSCYDDYATTCYGCDGLYDNEDHESCPYCVGDLIQNYSTKFSPLLFHVVNDDGTPNVLRGSYLPDHMKNEVFLGLEHEMENMTGAYSTSKCAELFADMSNADQIMLKHDGSLSDGFECVSQPHTLEAFMKFYDWEVIREAQLHGMRGWDVGSREVGIHIHINRKAFHTKPEHNRYNCSPHLHAFMHFVYSNIGSIKRIAGRNVHYGHMSERYLDRAFAIARHGHSQDARTQAINLMNNETVELRMFRSTMRVERIQAYLQFADAAVRYTATNRVEKMRDRFHFADFAKWVEVQPRYKQLSDLIVEVDAVAHAPARPNIIDVTNAEHDNDHEFVPCQSDDQF